MKTTALSGLIIVAGLSTACAQAPALAPAVAPTLAPTIVPTSTGTPTPLPTKIPTPTPTATPEPPPLAGEFLTDVQLRTYDSFDSAQNWDWDARTGSLDNGMFQMRGTGFWASSFAFRRTLKEGDALMLRFKVQKANGTSEFVFFSGTWETDSFRQFGIYNDRSPSADLFQGKNGLGGKRLHGNFALKPDTWYGLLMAIGPQGQFLAVMWDPEVPGHQATYNETLGSKWERQDWLFMPKADAGEVLSVDDFYWFRFGAIK